jgi:uncharacterized iron-regulated membrane protein
MTRRLIAQIHLWIGLTLCLPLVILGLTGSVLVFEDELRGLLDPPAERGTDSGDRATIAEILTVAQAAAPFGHVAAAYTAPAAAGGLAVVRLAPAQRGSPGTEGTRIAVDPVSLTAYPEASNDLLRQIFQLHSTLLLKNREGRQIVGWLGIAMVALGLSGIVNWWPQRRGWGAAFRVSRKASGYRLHRELHGAVGIWAWLVFVTVSLAGVCLAFPDTVRAGVAAVLPARDFRSEAAAITVAPIPGTPPIGVDAAVALAGAARPGMTVRFVVLPPRPDRPYRIGLARAGGSRGSPVATVFVDQWRHQIMRVTDPRDFTAGETILAWQHAIHAGQAFGLMWKLPVFVAGLLPLLFAITGVTMWWRRRADGRWRRNSIRSLINGRDRMVGGEKG